MLLRQIYDPHLSQYAYLIGCQRTGEALIVDPQRDIVRYQNIAEENGLTISAVTETHIHADFVSGVAEFAANSEIAIYLSGAGGSDWSYKWPGKRANTTLLKNGDKFMVGNIKVEALHTPGHTPEHLCFLITDLGGGADEPMALLSGDFLFVGDVGRPDLLETAAGKKGDMEPSAKTLRASLSEKLSKLGDYLQVFPGHGAGSACGKALGAVPSSTLGYERRFNDAFKLALSDSAAFVKDILQGQPDPPLYFETMKRVNRDGITVTGSVPEVTKLTIPEFKTLAADSGVKIVDTREDRNEFDSNHVRRSINAPLYTPFFSTSTGSYLNINDKIILILENESEVEVAAVRLYRIGFDKIIGWITFDEVNSAGLATSKIQRIMFDRFNTSDALKEGEIIDVRTTAEFTNEHLQGAKSIPYTRLKARLNELPKNKRLYVHCASGRRATLATSFLSAEGFDAVHVDGMFRI